MLGTEEETNVGDRAGDECWGPSLRQILRTEEETNAGDRV